MTDQHGRAWHVLEAEDVVAAQRSDREKGLSAQDAQRRLEEFGENRIRSGEVMPWWRLLLHQFTDPLIYILFVAAAVSLLIGEVVDAAVILVVVLVNAAIGFVQELRARTAIQALAKMSAPKARVIRDGGEQEIPTEAVVPGDILVLSAGARVPADARILTSHQLQADESALTGESLPVSKQVAPVDDERAVPGDQLSMVFSGTNVTRGRGRALVVRTGEATELGRIAEATYEVAEVKTPIKEKMERLGRGIGIVTVVLSVVVVAGGLLAGAPLHEVIRTAVALAVAAVPEALPVVLTVTLAVGMQRMAARNAIIRSLPAVETLGSTTVVCSDKTGTLTENRMTVRMIWAGGEELELQPGGGNGGSAAPSMNEAARRTTLAGLLANEVEELAGVAAAGDGDGGGREVGAGEAGAGEVGVREDGAGEVGAGEVGVREGRAGEAQKGDPTELALLVSARTAGYDVASARSDYPQLDVIPFESERQYMATLNDTPEGRWIFVKGSPEAVLARCTRQLDATGGEQDLDADAARAAADRMAGHGFRVLAMALERTDRNGFDDDGPGHDLVFAGLQAMEDPVRPEAVTAVRAARSAGIRVIMLTGDHARTARAIGEQLGLSSAGDAAGEGNDVAEGRRMDEWSDEELDRVAREVNVFARVSPEHKLKLVERLKAQGHIVAVTGDGVNDAPALQAAHLGVAMGKGGTDVAREASDMVLADDNFASITNAVEEGRVAFSNIRKVTYFLLSTAIGLVVAILSSLAGPWPLPFVPVQVLWINLVTNGLQDVALAFEKGEPGLLREPPRDPREGVMHRPVLWRLGAFGLLIAAGTLFSFWWMLRQDVPLELARSVAMTQMVLFQFFHVLNARSFHRSILQVPLGANRFLAISLVLAMAAHIAALYLAPAQRLFETAPLALGHWILVVAVGASIIVAAEVDKFLVRRRMAQREGA